MPNTSFGPPGRHAGLGELLGDDHLLQRRQPAAAVLDRPARGQVPGLVQHAAPPLDEVADGVALELADAGPVAGQLLGEERLDLVAVRLGLGAICRVHRCRSYRVHFSVSGRGGPPGQRRRADERGHGAERRDVEGDAVLGAVGAGADVGEAAALVELAPRRLQQRQPEGRRARRRRAARGAGRTRPPPMPRPGRSSSRCARSPTPALAAAAGWSPPRSPTPTTYDVRQPSPPHGQGSPSGSTTTWPSAPALPRRPCSSRPLQITPASTASDISSTMHVVDVLGATRPALGQDPGLAGRAEHRRQPGEVAHPLAQLEVLPHGQVQRRHRAARR